MKFAATAIALALAVPAAAQAQESTTVANCFAERSDAQLSSDLVDDMLAESGLVERPARVNERLIAVAEQCIADYSVQEGDIDAFFSQNLAYIVSAEVRRRIIGFGYDIGPADELLRALAAQPDLAVDDYIDARPDEFENPMNAAMDRAGYDREMGVQLLGAYLGMEMMLQRN